MANKKTVGIPGFAGVAVVLGIEIAACALLVAMFLESGGAVLIGVVVLVAVLVLLNKKFHSASDKIQKTFVANKVIAAVVAAILVLLLPILLRTSPYWIFILITGLLFVIASLGLNLQLGSTGMMNLAGAAFYAFGAYSAGLLALRLGLPPWLTIPLAALIAGLFSILLFIPALKTKGHYLGLVTIAFQYMVQILVENMEWTGGPQGLMNIPLFKIFGYSFNSTTNLFGMTLHPYTNFYYLVVVVTVLVAFVCYRIYRSWVGVTLATIRDDEVAAKTNGVILSRWKLVIFVLGNCFIGLAGALYSHIVGFISPPNFAFDKSLVMVSIVILGGMDNIFGIIIGAMLLIVLPEKLRFIQDYRYLIYGLVLMITLIFKPRGLLPFVPRNYTDLIDRAKKKLATVAGK